MKNSINYWAVFVAAIASVVAGYVWYMVLFTAPYVKALDKAKEQLDRGPGLITASLIQLAGNIAMAWVLARLMNALGYTTLQQGLGLSLLLWFGLVAAVIGPLYAFEANSFRLFLINAGAALVYLLICGTVLSLWK